MLMFVVIFCYRVEAISHYSSKVLSSIHELKWSLYKPENIIFVLCNDCYVQNDIDLNTELTLSTQRIQSYQQGKMRDVDSVSKKSKVDLYLNNANITTQQQLTLLPPNTVTTDNQQQQNNKQVQRQQSNVNTDTTTSLLPSLDYSNTASCVNNNNQTTTTTTTGSISTIHDTSDTVSPLFGLGYYKKHYTIPTHTHRPTIYGISCQIVGCKRGGRPYSASGSGGYGSLISHLKAHHKQEYQIYKQELNSKQQRKSLKKENIDSGNTSNVNNTTNQSDNQSDSHTYQQQPHMPTQHTTDDITQQQAYSDEQSVMQQ